MPVSIWCRRGASFLAFVGLFPACNTSSTIPGTSEGTFAVVGTNSCGASLGPTSPWDFNAEVSKDGTTVYLQSTSDTNLLTGTLSGAAATLTSVVTSNIGGSADAGTTGPCNLTQTTTYTVTFDAADSPTTFTGSASYTYSVATTVSTSTDCSGQLAASGGAYATLPCTASYAVTAKKK